MIKQKKIDPVKSSEAPASSEQASVAKPQFNRVDIILEAIWLAIIFFIPIYFGRGLHNVFEIPKNILFQILTEILLFVYLIKLVLYGLPQKEFLWQRIKHLIPAFIFIVVLGISTILSQVPWFSFWGSWERRMGYLAWLHFFVFTIILVLNIKNKKQIYRSLLAISFSSVLVLVYGIIQALGIDFFVWTYDPFAIKRIFSSIGQPNFLGSWLLLVIPVALFGITKKGAASKTLYLILLIFLILALFLTKSRGAWIGFIALLWFISVFLLWKKNKKLALVPILCLILIIFFVSYFNKIGIDEQSLSKIPFLYRVQTFADLKMAGNYRLMHWRASLDLIKEKPILGYGLGSQRFNFPRYYTPEFAIYEKPNIYLDYAHNDILDVLLASGVLGLGAYLFFIINIFWLGLKYFLRNKAPDVLDAEVLENGRERENKNGVLILLLLSGLFGYLVSILFSFHIMSTLVYFWLFISLIMVLTPPTAKGGRGGGDGRGGGIQTGGLEKSDGGLTIKKSLIILLLLCLLLVSFWHFNARLYLSSYYLFNSKKAKAINNINQAIFNHKRAIYFSPNDPYFRQEFALSLYQFSNFVTTPTEQEEELTLELKTKLDWLNLGIENIETIPSAKRPIEALIWLPWLQAEKAYLTKQESDFIAAEKSYEYVASFSPQTALIYNKWCDLKIYNKKWQQAIDMCKKALSLYPDIDHPHINDEHRRDVVNEMIPVYINLSDIYQLTGKTEKAIDIAEKSVYLITKVYLSNYPKILTHIYQKLFSLYSEIKQEEVANFYLNKAQELKN